MNKTTTTTILAMTALCATLQAGESYSLSSSKGGLSADPIIPAVAIAPASDCDWSWFTGGSVGYLTDWEEPMYTLHLGLERECENSSATHALFLEVGYTEKEFSIQGDGPQGFFNSTSDASIIPITLNYKYEDVLSGDFNWYAGAGAGIALSDFSSDDDTTFYAHVFAGVVYNINSSWEAFAGARYIFMNEPTLPGLPGLGSEVSLDGDVLVELGLRYNF